MRDLYVIADTDSRESVLMYSCNNKIDPEHIYDLDRWFDEALDPVRTDIDHEEMNVSFKEEVRQARKRQEPLNVFGLTMAWDVMETAGDSVKDEMEQYEDDLEELTSHYYPDHVRAMAETVLRKIDS